HGSELGGEDWLPGFLNVEFRGGGFFFFRLLRSDGHGSFPFASRSSRISSGSVTTRPTSSWSLSPSLVPVALGHQGTTNRTRRRLAIRCCSLPPTMPPGRRALAASRPSLPPSKMSSRVNSARAANTLKGSWPSCPVVLLLFVLSRA